MNEQRTLVESLALFNRKERHLLMLRATGTSVRRPPPLGECFRTALERALTIKVPATAWWAIDYHFDWLAGALLYYVRGDAVLDDDDRGLPCVDTRGRTIVKGNQEDADLIIAFDQTLILCEAKAYGSYSNSQSGSKSVRLETLYQFYKEEIQDPGQLSFYFLHIGPNNSQKLGTQWPNSGRGIGPEGKPRFVKMRLPDRALYVERQGHGHERWTVKEIPKNKTNKA